MVCFLDGLADEAVAQSTKHRYRSSVWHLLTHRRRWFEITRERDLHLFTQQPKLHCCVDSTNYLQFVLNSKPLASGSTYLVQHDTRHITNQQLFYGPTLMSVACSAFFVTLPPPAPLYPSLALSLFLRLSLGWSHFGIRCIKGAVGWEFGEREKKRFSILE